jgi:hypothetical protein
VLIHASGFNLGLVMRQLLGVGRPRGFQGRPRGARRARESLPRDHLDGQRDIGRARVEGDQGGP